MDVKIETLREVPLFRGLSDAELKQLIGIGKQVRHRAGDQIVEADQSGVGLHVILEGIASITVGGSEVARFGPGEYFGEMSLLDGKPRSATVTAVGDLTTFAVTSWDFERLIERHPTIMRALLVELSARIRLIESTRS
jgi:CRP/FNR family cyclic AMP-dependent transcriptional regulator